MGWTDKLAEFLRLNDGEQAYVGYPQMQVGLNKPRQAGYATGFLEGATGADSMQPKNPITDPNYDQYAKGKNIGEAVGIGAMAVPGYAMALKAGAPKAAQMVENYMVKTGGMSNIVPPSSRKEFLQESFNKIAGGEKPVRSAVVLIGDDLFTGNTHAQAFQKAIENGVVRKEGGKYIYPKGAEINSDLFMLNDGRIVDRLEASRMLDVPASESAIKANKMQMRPANQMSVDEYMKQAEEIKNAKALL
jgi:hypothetical protein